MKIETDFLESSPFTRPSPGYRYIKDKIVVHWVGNPGTTAKQNVKYLKSVPKQKKPTFTSWHYTIGLDGEIIQTIPEEEAAYHASSAKFNKESIGIECCHPGDDGKFTEKTYKALVELVKMLKECYKIKTVLRHYDCPRTPPKECPKWFVKEPKEWRKFLKEIK